MFSPRSANYGKLEDGMGPSRSSKRFAWKKFAIGAAVLIGLVYVFGPRRSELDGPETQAGYTRPDPAKVDTEPLLPPLETKRPGAVTTTSATPVTPAKDTKGGAAAAASPRPTSHATDPDPSKTVHCTTPHRAGTPLVQYALMIDAGSTGSRIHVYKFNNCGPSAEYEYEVFRMTQPGLSSYAGHPAQAAESLDVLLDVALETVPAALRACTPVAVKATAGLRLTGATESAAILDAVRARLEAHYPFPVHGGADGVVIMDGADEGVFAWITANYLLDTIRGASDAHAPSYAVLDLGGASTQIVFEPRFGKPDETLRDGEHKYDLKFGGKQHTLYQHSYLGYGLMRARKHVHQLVDFMASIRPSNGAGGRVANPCLARGTERTVEVEDARVGTKRNVIMAGGDVGGFEACNRIVELVMAKDAICDTKPCSFNGVYQPSLMETFPSGKIMLLSYFYDRISPLLPARTASSPALTVDTIATLAHDVCAGESAWTTKWGANPDALEELRGRPEYCLDLTFMHGLLRLGYEFGGAREVAIAKQVDGTELGWCLGATIAMVGAELKCRI